MDLADTLNSAVEKLKSGKLTNEAQIKQAVILPILRSLGWDDADPESLLPEYSVDGRWVDYALLHLARPLVFLEAKKEGDIETKGEEQLFNYAANRGVPLLVLSDGNRWDFYLSMAEGMPTERRFFRLELKQTSNSADYVEFLEAHLSQARVVSGDARRSAEALHTSNRERKRAQDAIPATWQAMLEEPEEMIRDLLAEEVESRCGSRPELDDVEAFLKSSVKPATVISSWRSVESRSPKSSADVKQRTYKKSKIIGYEFSGECLEIGTASGTLAAIIKRLHRMDPTFLPKFASQTASKRRKLVARNRDELYPFSPQLIDHSQELVDGWWLGTNLSSDQIRGRILKACEMSGVEYGRQLRLIER